MLPNLGCCIDSSLYFGLAMQHPKGKKIKNFKVEFLVFIFIQKLEKGQLIVHSANICSSFGYIFYQAVTRVLM